MLGWLSYAGAGTDPVVEGVGVRGLIDGLEAAVIPVVAQNSEAFRAVCEDRVQLGLEDDTSVLENVRQVEIGAAATPKDHVIDDFSVRAQCVDMIDQLTQLFADQLRIVDDIGKTARI